MPIKIQLAIREGWKATKNDRFGEAFEIHFIDAMSGLVLWRYAPKLADEAIFADAFELLKEYDEKLSELRDIIAKVDGKTYQAGGSVPQMEASQGVRQSPAACGAGGIRGQGQPCPAQTTGQEARK